MTPDREALTRESEREIELLQQAVEHLGAVGEVLSELEGLNESGKRGAAYLGMRFDGLVETLGAWRAR